MGSIPTALSGLVRNVSGLIAIRALLYRVRSGPQVSLTRMLSSDRVFIAVLGGEAD